MTLTPISAQERTEIAQLLTTYWKDRGMQQYDQKWAEAYLTEGHKKEIKSDEFFVYKEQDKIIGTVSLVTDVSDVAEIRDMVVKPDQQKKGYGKKMLADLIQLAKQRKLRKLYALVPLHLEGPLQRAGFTKEGVLKSHFAPGENLAIMSMFL